MHGPNAPPFQLVRRAMEDEWTPPLMKTLDIDEAPLPVIWDADFLYSPRDPSGADTYVLCEINVSSCFAIRDEAPVAIARTIKGPHPSKFGIRPIRAAAPRAPGPWRCGTGTATRRASIRFDRALGVSALERAGVNALRDLRGRRGGSRTSNRHESRSPGARS
jgi:hypothetical protein